MRFYLNKFTELTPKLLQKMIEAFTTNNLPKMEKYEKYYEGLQKIMSKKYKDANKPCSHPITNFCLDITDSYNGYIATPGFITYHSDEDIESIMDVLKYNDYQTEDNDFLGNALKYGTASELMFTDELGQTRFKLIDPKSCFAVYDDSLTGDMTHFIRFYQANTWEDSDEYIVDVYDDINITTYKMNGLDGTPAFVEQAPHYFAQCPANVFYLSDDKAIFDCILELQDAYNELLGSEIDDFSAFVDAYLYMTGCDADPEDIADMKENRVLLLPEGSTVGYLTRSTSDTQIENMLKRINDNIYRIAHCPDFSSETFVGGVASGIALQYRLCGMETRAGKIEAQMTKALYRRIELIAGMASLKLGEDICNDITIDFRRNIPEDEAAATNLALSLHGIVSDSTLLAQLPFIDDVQGEIEKIQAEKPQLLPPLNFQDFGSDEEF